MIPLKCDFHVHYIELMTDNPESMIDKYHEFGYGCIVLTEHDQCLDVDLQRGLVQYAEGNYGDRLLVGFGEELTFWDDYGRNFNGGDILGLFVSAKIAYERHNSPERSIREIHEQGGIAISAHDAHSNSKTDTEGLWGIRRELDLDGFEIINAGKSTGNSDSDTGLTYPEEAVAEDYICLANSDAHNVAQLSDTAVNHGIYTVVFADDRSLGSVRSALERRQTVAVYGDRYYGKQEYVEMFRCMNE